MANVHDVANYILRKQGSMSAMKLQKLVYYSQAWHLVWEEKALFRDKIQAWANGPVAPGLYRVHRGQFEVSKWPAGSPTNLTAAEKESIDVVLDYYGPQTGQWLSELTHREQPWREARAGLAPGERGTKEITHAALAEYYGSLVAAE